VVAFFVFVTTTWVPHAFRSECGRAPILPGAPSCIFCFCLTPPDFRHDVENRTQSFGSRRISKSWIARVNFCRVSVLMLLFPFLKFRIAYSATLDWRDKSLVENRFAWARIVSNILDPLPFHTRGKSHLPSTESRTAASGIMDRSTPPAHRARNGRRRRWHLLTDIKVSQLPSSTLTTIKSTRLRPFIPLRRRSRCRRSSRCVETVVDVGVT
jgi:hypothetical protein